MKKILNLFSFLVALSFGILTSCKNDSVDPEINPVNIADDDYIQITNNRNFVPVVISANDDDEISSIKVNIYPEGGTTAIASNTVKQIINNNLNRFTINVPFPLPEVAPSGKYTVEYTIEDKKGNKNTKSYIVNLENNQIVGCSGKINPSGGNNVVIELNLTDAALASINGDQYQDIYITGSFEGYSGGDESKSQYKFTKTSNKCYYVEVNLPADAQFKITRGDWPREIKNADGSTPPNSIFKGEKFIKMDVYNWGDKPTVTQTPNATSAVTVLPFEAIQSGKTTVVIDIASTDATPKYYLVKKGATSLTDAITMYKVDASTKIAGALPKGSTDEYVVVKNEIAKTGVNGFGYDVPIKISGTANPFNSNAVIRGFKTEYTPPYSTSSLLLVGGSSPAGWNNSTGNNQVFASSAPGKFSYTTTLTKTGDGYLIIPIVTNWDSKIGKASGTFSSGTLSFGGGNFNAPAGTTAEPEGSYKIDIDLIAGTYTLTKL